MPGRHPHPTAEFGTCKAALHGDEGTDHQLSSHSASAYVRLLNVVEVHQVGRPALDVASNHLTIPDCFLAGRVGSATHSFLA